MEKKRYEIPTNKQKLSGAPIVYTEQNSQWYLTISVGLVRRKGYKPTQLYTELWEEYHDWVLENWRDENLTYYLRVTD